MNRPDDDFAPQYQIRSELPPHAFVPHWVTLNVSAQALKLYSLYAAHGSGDSVCDRVVWPTLDDLARMMRLSRGDKVTPYMRELEGLGAISVEEVRSKSGMRRRYRITVRVLAPAGYAGPMTTGDWYAQNPSEDPASTVNSAVSAGQAGHPVEGVSGHPLQGGTEHPLEGVVRRTKSKKNNYKKNQGAPLARSAADASRSDAVAEVSTTGAPARERVSGGCAASGGAKAPRKSPAVKKSAGRGPVRMSRAQGGAVRQVEQALPAPLRGLLPKTRVPVLRDAILEALECRTAEQIAERVARRWWEHGYADDAVPGGKGLGSAVGVAVALVRPSVDCPEPMCEDGMVLDSGQFCRACTERRKDHRPQRPAAQRPVPSPRDAPRPSAQERQVWWTCSEAECRAPGKGQPPQDGLCPACRTRIQAAVDRLAAELAEVEAAREQHAAQAWDSMLTEAYAAHRAHEEAAAARLHAAAIRSHKRRADEEETRLLREQLAREHPELAALTRTQTS